MTLRAKQQVISVMLVRRTWSALGVLALGALALVIVRGQDWMINRDFFTYWGGGRGLLDGANLYSPHQWSEITFGYGSTWLPNPVFIYAPPTAIFFAPLAALSIQTSSVLWIGLSELFVAAVVVMITKDLHWTRLKLYAPFWAVGFLFFLPVLLTLLMGQVSALVLFVVAGSAVLWDRGKWLEGGLLIGIAVVKPQPVLLLLPLLGLWLIVHRRWAGLIGMALSFGVSVFASFLLFPTFVSDWQTAAITKVGGVAARMPTIWGLGSDVFGPSPLGPWVIGVLVLGIAMGSIAIVLRLKDAEAIVVTGVALIPSLLVAPYLWTYDQILLIIPLLISLIRLDQREYSFWAVALLPLVFAAVAFFLFIGSAIRLSDTWTSLLPILVGLMFWSAPNYRNTTLG
jgi:hypothetical protein